MLTGQTYRRIPRSATDARLTLKLPKTFSLIDAPKETIGEVINFASGVRQRRQRSIFFDHAGVRNTDLGAESLLRLVAAESRKEIRSRGRRLPGVSGTYPRDEWIRRLIRSVGVIRGLNVTHEFLPQSDSRPIRIFRAQSDSSGNISALRLSTRKSEAVAQFVTHIDTCLGDRGYGLTHFAQMRLSAYIGEIIGNAEDHSGEANWTILGYLDNQKHSADCEIVIYNFGKSIAETFRELNSSSFAYSQVAPYLEKHSHYFLADWTVDDLLTLIALQGHISSKNTDRYTDRGQGTVDLIEFFQRIHADVAGHDSSDAKMSILSGSTHILFDGTYRMQEGENGRKIIAFNDANDLGRRPDGRYVGNLGTIRFPGTAIAIRFPLPRGKGKWVRSKGSP